jgi:hypothetical protein
MAPSKCDGAARNHMGVAHHGERSVLGSMLGLGRTSGYRIGGAADRPERHWNGAMTPCRTIRLCSGSAAVFLHEPLALKPRFSIGVQDRCPGRVNISHQLSPARVAIGMVPLRQGEISCAEVPLAHGIDIDS